MKRSLISAPIVALLFLHASGSLASETAGHGKETHGGAHHSATADIGQPGHASEATRTVTVTMTDNAYDPKKIEVEPGETIRFVVKNAGQLVHEFNLGTAAMHAAHQQEMLQMMQSGVLMPTHIDHSKMHGGEMKHDDPNSVLIEPGKQAEIVWQFSGAAELEFACNVPGHYASGMVGHVKHH